MSQLRKIVLTGGGTAGHVTPNLALVPLLKKEKFEIHYIGSKNGIEKNLISLEKDITYHEVRTGKLRRYFSWDNFKDPFKVIAGFGDARRILKEIKPDVVFSKGGFVAVPVVAAAKRLHIPVVAHESDITPGLANKITKRFAKFICLTFPDSLKEIAPPKGIYTGTPIRENLYSGNPGKVKEKHHLDSKPILMMMGGSSGAKAINTVLRESLDELLKEINVIHLCGKGNLDPSLNNKKGYIQFEYLNEELPDYFAASDYILSRAGSNSIHEFLALNKPMLLVPLPLSASRGDQIMNAKSFESRKYALVLEQEYLNKKTLIEKIHQLQKNADSMRLTMSKNPKSDGTQNVMKVILSALNAD